MEFKEFKKVFQSHVDSLLTDQQVLFVTDVDKDLLWDTYLSAFPPGTNEIYRQRPEHDCSCCRHFIKDMGSVVAIRDNRLVTMWDFDPRDRAFTPVMQALSERVKAARVRDVFVTKLPQHGTDKSRELLDQGDVHTWDHFHVDLPAGLVFKTDKSVNELASEFRDVKNVFRRSLDEIAKEAIESVLDLIAEKTLYRGEEWQAALQKFLALHSEYHALPENEKDNFCWLESARVGGSVGKIRNHSIGVLLQDITAGVELLEAVRKYEAIVAPTNYKRPKAILTKKMIEDAEKKVTELGLLNSLGRRHAELRDITVNNVLWANRNAQRHMGGVGGVFELLKQEASVDPKKFKDLPGVGIDMFVAQVLPTATSLEVLVENRHEPNLMSLIAPQVAGSRTLFKWDNGFSWAYNGNIADSMKQRVKAAGGNVEGVLRFSLQWNDGHDNRNDYDAHCIEPNTNHIYFRNKFLTHLSSGRLDVDIVHPNHDQVAVENITWTNREQMQEGEYRLFVHNYSHRGGRSGFDAEIEYDGQVYEYAYHKELAQGEEVTVARLKFSRRDGLTFVQSLPSTTSAKTVWGLQTNQFHPVSVFMFSPNYWDGQGVGNRHYFFMLAGCKNDSRPNGFFNEYLREEFMEHKRVFEVLGGKMRVEASDHQLSGLGFSSTKRNSLTVKVDDRMVNIVL